MKDWEKFKTFKQRGEWVEMQFMAAAALHGFGISKPRGGLGSWDVGIDLGLNFLRIQVKSTTHRRGSGYFCEFKPKQRKKHSYTLRQINVFAA